MRAVEALKREMEQENEQLALEGHMEETVLQAGSTPSGSGSELDQDEVAQSALAGEGELSVIGQEQHRAAPTLENEPQILLMKTKSAPKKTQDLPSVPSSEGIPKSQRRSQTYPFYFWTCSNKRRKRLIRQ